MVKIRLTTTLKNNAYFNGPARKGTEHEVPESYAKELVEAANNAEYVESEYELVEVAQGEYPKKFLSQMLPAGIRDEIRNVLLDADIHTFYDLLDHEDLTNVRGIGRAWRDGLLNMAESALEKFLESE